MITGRGIEMDSAILTYADVVTKLIGQKMEAEDKGFVASDQFRLHLGERFDVAEIHVVAAVDHGNFWMLRLITER